MYGDKSREKSGAVICYEKKLYYVYPKVPDASQQTNRAVVN